MLETSEQSAECWTRPQAGASLTGVWNLCTPGTPKACAASVNETPRSRRSARPVLDSRATTVRRITTAATPFLEESQVISLHI